MGPQRAPQVQEVLPGAGPSPPRQHRPSKPRSHGSPGSRQSGRAKLERSRSSLEGSELALLPPTGEMLFPAPARFASEQPRGWNEHQEARTGARDTHSATESCPFLSHPGDSSEPAALGDRREGPAGG